MNLIHLFGHLRKPLISENVFNSETISEFPNFRLAKDYSGFPVILFEIIDSRKSNELHSFRLKYLTVQSKVRCTIVSNNKKETKDFTLIVFCNSEPVLQEYFLKFIETLIKKLGLNPSQIEVFDSIKKMIEVFRVLTEIPSKTIRGLWSELFLIEKSNQCDVLIEYWHNLPSEKFDFNSGFEKVEVKSNANFDRSHIFSYEQLNSSNTLIASIFVRESLVGFSIHDLVDRIIDKVNGVPEFVDKLQNLVARTLGSSLEQSMVIKFDYLIASDSLVYFYQMDIPRILPDYIPIEISELKFRVDLSNVPAIDISSIKSKGLLFSALL